VATEVRANGRNSEVARVEWFNLSNGSGPGL